jgi:hypothetical protein
MVVVDKQEVLTEEEKRLRENRDRKKYWQRWGSYLAERQWATGMFPFFYFRYDC